MTAAVATSSDLPQAPAERGLPRWATLLILLALVLFLGALTGPRVFHAPLWGDELRTWRDGIERPLIDVLTWRHNPDHAPLGHLLARGGAAIFGVDHPWALRLGSWLCGLACVPALWWMGRTLWTNGAGLFMAAMFCVDPNISYQMTQARMYAPLMLSAILAMTLAGSLLIDARRSPWPRVVLLGVALAFGIWTHSQIYALVIALLLIALGLLFDGARRRSGIALLIALAIGCGLGAQGIRKIISRHDAEAVTAADVTDAPGGQLEDAVHKLTGKSGISYAILAATLLGLFIIARDRPTTHRPLVVMLALVIAVALVNLLIAARYRPVAHARYLTILQPPLWFALSVVLVALWAWRPHRYTLGVGAVIAFLVLGIFEFGRMRDALEEHPLARPFEVAARAIRTSINPGDRFVMVPRSPYGMYTRYYGLSLDDAVDDALSPQTSARTARAKTSAAELERGTIWLLCVVPPKNIALRFPLDDASRVVGMIADRRGIKVPADVAAALEKNRRWHAAVVRIDVGRITLRENDVAATDTASDTD